MVNSRQGSLGCSTLADTTGPISRGDEEPGSAEVITMKNAMLETTWVVVDEERENSMWAVVGEQ